jgi:hypothetical protein
MYAWAGSTSGLHLATILRRHCCRQQEVRSAVIAMFYTDHVYSIQYCNSPNEFLIKRNLVYVTIYIRTTRLCLAARSVRGKGRWGLRPVACGLLQQPQFEHLKSKTTSSSINVKFWSHFTSRKGSSHENLCMAQGPNRPMRVVVYLVQLALSLSTSDGALPCV